MSNQMIKQLRTAAKEIADADELGWGNVCTDAADHIEQLEAQLEAFRDAGGAGCEGCGQLTIEYCDKRGEVRPLVHKAEIDRLADAAIASANREG